MTTAADRPKTPPTNPETGQGRIPRSRPAAGAPTFYSVPDTARILGMSAMTLYRAIQDGEFPAVRIRGRLIVPARAIEAMADSAVIEGHMVDSAEWVRRD